MCACVCVFLPLCLIPYSISSTTSFISFVLLPCLVVYVWRIGDMLMRTRPVAPGHPHPHPFPYRPLSIAEHITMPCGIVVWDFYDPFQEMFLYCVYRFCHGKRPFDAFPSKKNRSFSVKDEGLLFFSQNLFTIYIYSSFTSTNSYIMTLSHPTVIFSDDHCI